MVQSSVPLSRRRLRCVLIVASLSFTLKQGTATEEHRLRGRDSVTIFP